MSELKQFFPISKPYSDEIHLHHILNPASSLPSTVSTDLHTVGNKSIWRTKGMNVAQRCASFAIQQHTLTRNAQNSSTSQGGRAIMDVPEFNPAEWAYMVVAGLLKD
jgi:hypothetical protein